VFRFRSVGHSVGGSGRFLPLVLKLLQVPFELVKAFLPELPKGVQPAVQLLKRLGSELTDAPVGDGFHFDEARFIQDAEVFRRLRLADVEAYGNLADCQGLLNQQFDDV